MARQPLFVGISLTAVMMAGCAIVGPLHGPLHSQITGMVSQSSTGEYVFSDFARARLDNQPLYHKLDPYLRVKTEEIVKMEVSQVGSKKDFDYSVLMGPPLGSGGTVEGRLVRSSPDPALKLVTPGWLFASCRNPYVVTEWVSAIASGSAIAIEIVDGTKQRVYFIEGDKITVTCLIGSNTQPRTWTTRNTYITVTRTGGTCEFNPDPNTGVAATTIGGAESAFIDKVKLAAKAAGWGEIE